MSTKTHKQTRCSKCGSFKVARIIYGMPDFTERLEKLEEQGKIVLADVLSLAMIQNMNVPSVARSLELGARV